MNVYAVLALVSAAGLISCFTWDKWDGYQNSAAKALGIFCFCCTFIFTLTALFSTIKG